jgi:hypothetical protein
MVRDRSQLLFVIATLVAAGTIGSDGPQSREISGTVRDAASGQPIRHADVDVVGLLSVDGPNQTCTDDHGEFRLRVPDGEAWLAVRASGFLFTNTVVSPAQQTVHVRGLRVPPGVAGNVRTTQIPPTSVVSVELLNGTAATDRYGQVAAGGIYIVRLRGGDSILALPSANVIVDGQVRPDSAISIGPCSREFRCEPPKK